MITWPVAMTRAVLTTALVWGLGAALVFGLFSLAGAETVVRDVEGRAHTEVVWLGAHAFFACTGPLLGLTVGGGAVVEAFLAKPASAVVRVGVPLLVLAWLVVAALVVRDHLGQTMAVAEAVGALIGVACGAAYLLIKGAPTDDRTLLRRVEPPVSRGWGSR